MQTFKPLIYSSLALLLLSACSGMPAEEQKTETVVQHKLDAVVEAKKSVEAINIKTEEVKVAIAKEIEPLSGSILYTSKCASCHGNSAQKSALNSSLPIAGWDSQKTQDALNGYKAGTYGGKMKAIMQGQSRPLSDTEIKLIAEYIAVL